MLDFSEFEELIEEQMDDMDLNGTTEAMMDLDYIDGNWGEFDPWGSCEGICEEGTQFRWRRCDNPVPENGGRECVGEAFEEQICVILDPCPEIIIPVLLDISCTDWTYEFEVYYKRALVRVLKYLSKDTIEIEVPSCSTGDRRRRRLAEEYDAKVKLMITLDLDPVEVEALLNDPGNLNKTAYAGVEVLLADRDSFMSAMEEEALNVGSDLAEAMFMGTYNTIMDAFEAGDVIDSTAPEPEETTPFPTDEYEEYESGSWVEAIEKDVEEEEGDSSNVKGIVFLVFVIGLTVFVVTVLFLVSWLERKKCRERNPYDQLTGRK